LPPDFIKELEGLPGIARKRFLEGKWVGSDGLVYDRWDRAVHVRADGRGVRRVVLAVDEGYTNPFAALRVEIDGDGRLYVSGEFYRRQQNVSQKVAAVRAMGECEAVVVDPSAADLIRELRDAGLPVVPALNEVFDGIMKVQQRLTLAGDGYPRLTVDPGCDNLIREFETYEWKANRQSGATKDEPIKEHDHALDALRYAVAYLDRGLASVATGTPVAAPVRPPGPRGIQELIERPIRPEPWGSPRRELARAPRTRYT
jgi:phage terminase large subunit